VYLVRHAVARIDSITDGAPSLVLLISIVCPKFIVLRKVPGTFKEEGHRSIYVHWKPSGHPLSTVWTSILDKFFPIA